MKVQYVADDGTSFETEVECKSYELSQTFGADTRFLNVVDAMLQHLVTGDDRGNPVINFETEDEKTRVSIAIASHFETLRVAYETMCDDQHVANSKAKVPAKQGKMKTRGFEVKVALAKNHLRAPKNSTLYDDED